MLTELEGAILAEIHNRGDGTTFQVRRAFASSLSLEWKGSAGAVYPAVKRLEERGLIKASAAEGGRGARRLSLTESGWSAMMGWACDLKLATNVGIDPFRLRSSVWAWLEPDLRKRLFASLRTEILASLPMMQQTLEETDPVERVRVVLSMQLQQARLSTLDRWEADQTD